jgi:hypothetical protein
MTRIFIIVVGAALFLLANVVLVIWLVVADLLKEFIERKALRKLPVTSVTTWPDLSFIKRLGMK